MAKAKKVSIIILFALITVLGLIGLTACGKASIDLSGYTKVTYDCMGGHIDKLPTRTLYAKPNTLIVEPKGSIGLVEAKRTNYTLIGWYTAHGEGTYTESTDGDYVYYYTFEKDPDGDYVKTYFYYQDAAGGYVEEEVLGETVYVEATDSSSGQRFSMIEIYALYDETNEEHTKAERYSATAAYVLYDVNNPDHQNLPRYLATYTWDEANKWDFKNSRVGEEEITLYARWAYNLKIYWDYGNGTTYTYENGQLGVDITRGEKIPKTQLIPQKNGYTFTYWYKDAACTEKWDFAADVFPTDTSVTSITLHAGYVEGKYERIESAKQFKEKLSGSASGKYLIISGKYLIINDIDLKGATFAYSNVKITNTNGVDGTPGSTFKGEINGLGNKITGLIVNVKNTDTGKAGQTANRYFGLFGCAENAVITNLEVEGEIVVDSSSTSPVYIGTVLGIDRGNTKIENVKTTFTLRMTSDKAMTSNVYISGGVARKSDTSIIGENEFTDVGVLRANLNTTGTVTIVN